jgi:hypothetical protein
MTRSNTPHTLQQAAWRGVAWTLLLGLVVAALAGEAAPWVAGALLDAWGWCS